MMSQKGGGDGRGEKWITGIGEKIENAFSLVYGYYAYSFLYLNIYYYYFTFHISHCLL